jgi:hypothetical protein
MRIAVVQTGKSNLDPVDHTWTPQNIDHDYIVYDDETFPPRINAMTPRLQARLAKMSSWQMSPGYDYYIWIDRSCVFSDPDAIQWFLDQLGDADMAFFKHPDRTTVKEEADYVQERLDKNCPYITPRYGNERMKEQMEVVDPEGQLYATTAFIYKNDTPARDMLTIWWLHNSMYTTEDQLSCAHAIEASGAKVNMIDERYDKNKYIEFVRNK